MSPLYEKIYQLVANIPRGKVSTYGRIARAAGNDRYARQVGYALSALPADSKIPWHRVVNTKGEISQRSAEGFAQKQRQRLHDEGVFIDQHGRIDLVRYLCPAESMRPTRLDRRHSAGSALKST